jgi:tyrosine-protein kinase Etk/Wzc
LFKAEKRPVVLDLVFIVGIRHFNAIDRGGIMSNYIDSQERNPENNRAFLLVNIALKLWKRRIFITLFVGVFILLGIIYGHLSPMVYRAQAIISPPTSENDFPGLALGKDLPFDLSSSLFGSLGNNKEIVERYVTILQSDRLRIGVIDSFHLADCYNFTKKKKKYMIEDVIIALSKKCLIYPEKSTVIIDVRDKSPDLAAGIANFMVCMLDSINKEIARTQSGRKKEFLHQRMIENRDSLTSYEDTLVAFQKKHGIIDIQRQAEASVSIVAQTEVEMLVRELQLSLDESKFSRNAVGIFERNNDIRALREKLFNYDKSKETALLLPIKRIPEEALKLARMQRAIAVMDLLDRYLTKAYEEARLEEKTTVPTIAVLDPARVPQKRFAPKRKKIVTFFMGLGLSLGIVFSVMLDSLGPYKKEPSTAKSI